MVVFWERNRKMPTKLKDMVTPGEIRVGLGMRNIKTAVAVVFCLLIYEAIYIIADFTGVSTQHLLPMQTCTAAILCMQNTVQQTLSNGFARIIGTFYGGVLGILVLFISAYIPSVLEILIIAVAISLCICLCNLTGQQNACAISCVVLLTILLNKEKESQYISALLRLIETVVGIIVAGLVNKYFYIPEWMMSLKDYLVRIFKKKTKAGHLDIALVEKLKMNEYKNILIFDKPDDFNDFDGLTFDTTGGKAPYDFIFSFIFSYDDIENSIEEVHQKGLVMEGGLLYLAYPKEFFSFSIADNTFYRNTTFKKTDFFEINQYSVIGFNHALE